MSESLKTMLIWDGSQKNFAIFEDKVFERFLDGHGGRIAQEWYMGGCANKLTPWYELIGRLTP